MNFHFNFSKCVDLIGTFLTMSSGDWNDEPLFVEWLGMKDIFFIYLSI